MSKALRYFALPFSLLAIILGYQNCGDVQLMGQLAKQIAERSDEGDAPSQEEPPVEFVVLDSYKPPAEDSTPPGYNDDAVIEAATPSDTIVGGSRILKPTGQGCVVYERNSPPGFLAEWTEGDSYLFTHAPRVIQGPYETRSFKFPKSDVTFITAATGGGDVEIGGFQAYEVPIGADLTMSISTQPCAFKNQAQLATYRASTGMPYCQSTDNSET